MAWHFLEPRFLFLRILARGRASFMIKSSGHNDMRDEGNEKVEELRKERF